MMALRVLHTSSPFDCLLPSEEIVERFKPRLHLHTLCIKAQYKDPIGWLTKRLNPLVLRYRKHDESVLCSNRLLTYARWVKAEAIFGALLSTNKQSTLLDGIVGLAT